MATNSTTFIIPHEKTRYRPTGKQALILRTVKSMTDSGELVHMRKIVDNLPYVTSENSMVFSLKALLRHGWLVQTPYAGPEKRWKKQFSITEAGLKALSESNVNTAESFATYEEIEDLL